MVFLNFVLTLIFHCLLLLYLWPWANSIVKIEWNKIHTEVMYGCQNAIDQEKKKGRGGCNSNPLTGSIIKKTGGVDEDGKFVWELSLSLSRLSNHNKANIRNTGWQFTGGGSSKCNSYITKTATGVSIVWPTYYKGIITINAIQDSAKSLMDHFSITDHSVVGRLLEMHHWHSMNYFGHWSVGIYWLLHKEGETKLSTLTNNQIKWKKIQVKVRNG